MTMDYATWHNVYDCFRYTRSGRKTRTCGEIGSIIRHRERKDPQGVLERGAFCRAVLNERR